MYSDVTITQFIDKKIYQQSIPSNPQNNGDCTQLPQQRKRLRSKILSCIIINIQQVADGISLQVKIIPHQLDQWKPSQINVTTVNKSGF